MPRTAKHRVRHGQSGRDTGHHFLSVFKEGTMITGCGCAVESADQFSFTAGLGDDRLQPGAPVDEATAEVDNVARLRLALHVVSAAPGAVSEALES